MFETVHCVVQASLFETDVHCIIQAGLFETDAHCVVQAGLFETLARCVVQAGLELESPPPASSQVLGFQVCTVCSMHTLKIVFKDLSLFFV